MSAAVPFREAIEILAWIAAAPGRVRALQSVGPQTFGPHPYFVDWKGQETLVLVNFVGGAVDGVTAILVGPRYSNASDWISEAEGDPLDELPSASRELFELTLRQASDRLG